VLIINTNFHHYAVFIHMLQSTILWFAHGHESFSFLGLNYSRKGVYPKALKAALCALGYTVYTYPSLIYCFVSGLFVISYYYSGFDLFCFRLFSAPVLFSPRGRQFRFFRPCTWSLSGEILLNIFDRILLHFGFGLSESNVCDRTFQTHI